MQGRTMVWITRMALAAALLLTVVISAVWIRSYFIRETLEWTTAGYSRQMWIDGGKFLAQLTYEPDHLFDSPLRYGRGPASLNKHLPWWRHWWVDWRAGPMDDPSGGIRDRVLTIPLWMFLLGLGIVPALISWRVGCKALRTSRRRSGLCIACGYDLQGTPDRCPECGLSANRGE